MRKIIQLVAIVIVAGILGGCSKLTYISYKGGGVAIRVDDARIHINGTVLSQKLDNYSRLFVDQKVLRLDNGSIVTYEKARTDDQYEFNFEAVTTIKAVFDAREVNVVYFKDSFYMMQVIMADGSVLNMIVDHFDDQVLSYVYGMNTGDFRKLLRQLDPGNKSPKSPLIRNSITINNPKNAVLSRWNTMKINFIPLITPLRYMFGF